MRRTRLGMGETGQCVLAVVAMSESARKFPSRIRLWFWIGEAQR